MLCALPTRTPLQAVYCWQSELLNSVFSIQNSEFDIVHIEHLRGARYGLYLKSEIINHKSEIPIVWDSVDCISHLFEQAARHSRSPFGRFVTRFELARTRRYEALLVNRFDRVLVTSPVDAAALAQLANRKSKIENRKSEIEVLPNGVDLEYFIPGTALRDPDTIVFTGKMSYHANVTAAWYLINDVMPLIWQERPNVHFNIVGYNPPRQIRQLGESQTANQKSKISVIVSPADLRAYLQRAAVAVAPIPYGAGIQNKVLEAMACATPVVATPQAVSALQVTDGEQLLVGDGAEAFARQTLRLLQDAELRQWIGTAGRRFVERYHDWNKIVERLEGIYQQLSDRPVA
ncbi:MAG: glycosyltransferase, partial [Chloroflexota bacterium]